jgi:hypothetical protein
VQLTPTDCVLLCLVRANIGNTKVDTRLKQCKKNFSKWRQENHRKRYTPEPLRIEAVGLLTTYSVEELSAILEVPVSTIKSWHYERKKKDKDTAVDFVTLPSLKTLEPSFTADTPFECNMLLGNGIQLTLKFSSVDVVAPLVRSLAKDLPSCST